MTATPTTARRPHGQPVTLTVAGSEAVTSDLLARVDEACRQAEDRAAGAVVIWLRGGPASEPADRRWPGVITIGQVNRWERGVRRLERLPTPTVVVADGECCGPAAELLLAADYRIVERSLRLRLATPGHLAWPGMGLFRLVNQVGVARARQIALFGGSVSAEQALTWNLVDECVDSRTEARDRVAAVVAELSRLPGKEVAVRRRLLFDAATTSFDEAFGAHLAACDRTLRLAAASDPDPALAAS